MFLNLRPQTLQHDMMHHAVDKWEFHCVRTFFYGGKLVLAEKKPLFFLHLQKFNGILNFSVGLSPISPSRKRGVRFIGRNNFVCEEIDFKCILRGRNACTLSDRSGLNYSRFYFPTMIQTQNEAVVKDNCWNRSLDERTIHVLSR